MVSKQSFLILALLASTAVAQSNRPSPLTLDEALARALAAEDPALARFSARAEALEHASIAEAQLPDPMITGQIANVPVDSFDFDQDGMTQAVRIGIRQEFPAGRTLKLTGQQRRLQADVERARQALARRDIALEVRNAWLERVWHERAVAIVETTRAAVREQIDSLAARFATGRMHAQDILRAELELELLGDQVTEHRRRIDGARAALARYVGSAAGRPVPRTLPELADPGALAALEQRLLDHPAVAAEQRQIEAAEVSVTIAEQAYKPKFALEGGYGLRTDRADLASVGITLSLPLFPDKRQDRRRAAAVEQAGAESLDRDLLLHDLRRRLAETHASFQLLDQRVALYAGAVRERARQTAEAAVTTYASGQTDFAELIRARLAELNAELKRAELETRRAQAWAQLVWLTGDPS